ncbi:MAG: hemolysin III family protein [Elusimicrobia bacterium]|nr:hemolysin III family protein [Elusimicrobiota bacterium]
MRLVHYFGLNDPVSSVSHILAAVAALGGSHFLYRKGRGDALRSSSLMIFSASLLFLFSMSGVYHALPPGPWRTIFRRLDYAGIWIVIAGSATPVHILLFKGRWRWGLISLFWGAALTCLVLIDVYFTRLPYWSIVSAYIGVASLGVVSYAHITARYGWKESSLLFLGGISYVAGALIDSLEGPVILTGVIGAHELFHVLVIVGALLHWLFIYNWAGRRDHA